MNDKQTPDNDFENILTWSFIVLGYITFGVLMGLEFGTNAQQTRLIAIITYILEFIVMFVVVRWYKQQVTVHNSNTEASP